MAYSTIASYLVRLFDPFVEYCTTNASYKYWGVTLKVEEAASNPQTSFG